MDALTVLAIVGLLCFVGWLIWFAGKTHGGTDFLDGSDDSDE